MLGSDDWIYDLSKLKELEKYAQNKDVLDRFIEKKKENGQKPIFVILSKKSINENRKNIFSITHKEFNSILEKNINSYDNNKYAYLLKDFLENMNNFYGGSTMN